MWRYVERERCIPVPPTRTLSSFHPHSYFQPPLPTLRSIQSSNPPISLMSLFTCSLSGIPSFFSPYSNHTSHHVHQRSSSAQTLQEPLRRCVLPTFVEPLLNLLVPLGGGAFYSHRVMPSPVLCRRRRPSWPGSSYASPVILDLILSIFGARLVTVREVPVGASWERVLKVEEEAKRGKWIDEGTGELLPRLSCTRASNEFFLLHVE